MEIEYRKVDGPKIVAEGLELVRNIDAEDTMEVGRQYTLRVGVKDPKGGQKVDLDIVVYTGGSIELVGENQWIKRVTSDESATPAEFVVQTISEGHAEVFVDVYFHQHKLDHTFLNFEVISTH